MGRKKKVKEVEEKVAVAVKPAVKPKKVTNGWLFNVHAGSSYASEHKTNIGKPQATCTHDEQELQEAGFVGVYADSEKK